ncbi:UDP-N-acetyl-D-mannosaminuronate dehydrogenase [Lentisphaera araneosa HTCC2155]|uniref:UDP-N-acetyl-D-mannosaminuronate dehydrogenase n=1 Tax=Lentisphaera araneosa HTCC2155 TaxID=313628 RepID=A6DHG4_9BACT|nr:nucleotide sugar dehydrogenase [Lentisphaera araneosa]EDM29047.1 UDP-N-acetyl-D-mannosaminuronate dehydrogenase [Lentisphaera araneosa HTCC2155]
MNKNIAIIGLGYVGLPLAIEFGKKVTTLGFDINQARIKELNKGHDATLEVEEHEFTEAHKLTFTYDVEELKNAQIYIVTVPTPIDEHKRPDLSPLEKASQTVASVIKKGDIVIYESTVYPGATEEVCIPIIEKLSGLKYISTETLEANSQALKTENDVFYAGYSPERINPGDKTHRLPNIKKVTSGSTPEIGQEIDKLYQNIITAGTHLAPSIKVAEAAKVIENTQRDLNIALVNELALIFEKIGIDTLDVLEAAGTKWNFLPFRPGLVGGHCIGVDPYYLTHKAQQVGYQPEIILAGRRLNDGMGAYVANTVIKLMIAKGQTIAGAKVLVKGITFKENCPDIRNSRVIDVIEELQSFHVKVSVHDPWANAQEVKDEYAVDLVQELDSDYDAVILAVAHKEFKDLDIKSITHDNSVIYDIKCVLDPTQIDGRL